MTARIGTPVNVVYGAWLNDTGTPLVTTFFRAVTDDHEVSLNEEHDDFEWVSPATARDRLAEVFGRRAERALARAVTHHTLADGRATVDDVSSAPDEMQSAADEGQSAVVADLDPFAARADQFEGCETDREAWLSSLADAQELDLAELRERYG